ncbi:peptidoglycan-binding domain-containing protein [Curvivirga sp.]|uniref:peptidoglycan-binding domain-containing protein n=1 Tax=Curvivirga sp. TaxID=2856848 RepID=UPI003B58CFF5
MSKPYQLKEPIGPGYNMDPDDVRKTKSVLSETGHYTPPKFGITDIPDNQMIDAIRRYQKDNDLKVDGIIRPGGETAESLIAMGTGSRGVGNCRVCDTPSHHGVFHRDVCYECWNQHPVGLKLFNFPKRYVTPKK